MRVQLFHLPHQLKFRGLAYLALRLGAIVYFVVAFLLPGVMVIRVLGGLQEVHKFSGFSLAVRVSVKVHC